jgi:hypothetical protein
MSDAVIFVVVFAAFVGLRIIAATVIFYYILPSGDRCPNCDAVTLRVQPRALDRVMFWLRASWCYECGWEGMLRPGSLTPPPAVLPPHHFPVVNKERRPKNAG